MRISSVFFPLYISVVSAKEGSLIRGELKDKSVVGKQVDVDHILDTSCVLRGINPKHCLGKTDMNGDPCYVCGNKYINVGVCVNGDQKAIFDSTVNKIGMSNYLECDSKGWYPSEEDKNKFPDFLKQISVLVEEDESKSDVEIPWGLMDATCAQNGINPHNCIGKKAGSGGNCYFCGNKFINIGLCGTGAQKDLFLQGVGKVGLSKFIECDDKDWMPDEENKKYIEDNTNIA